MSADESMAPIQIDPAAMRAHAIAALESLGALRSGSKAKKVNALAKAVTQTVPHLAQDVDLLATGVEQLLQEARLRDRALAEADAEIRQLVGERDPGMLDLVGPCASCGALPGTRHSTACFYMHVQVGTVGDIAAARALYDGERTAKDGAYRERNALVAALAHLAPALGWTAGLARTAIEGWDPAWHNCVFIDTPAGQLSWHFHDREAPIFDGVPPYAGAWDGHTTEEKYARLGAATVRPSPRRQVSGWHCTRCGEEGQLTHDEDASVYDVVRDLEEAHEAVVRPEKGGCDGGLSTMRVWPVTEGTSP